MKPALLAFLAAAIWGLWWIPIRFLESNGLGGAAAGTVMNIGALVACGFWMLVVRRPIRLTVRTSLGAFLVGVAVALYSSALTYGDVVRIILLFYLAPAWSKVIEWAFMGLKWRWGSTLALILAFSGAVLILGGDVSGGAIRLGDAMALVSGLSWAAGAALIFSDGRSDAFSLTAITCLGAVLVGLMFMGIEHSFPAIQAGIPVAIGGMGFGVIYVLPILVLTLWSAQRLAPATLSFLLTAEILSGVLSAALLLDEPFGPLQFAGAALIIAGALSEVLPAIRSKPLENEG